MYNIGQQDDVKEKAANLANSVRTNVENVTNTVKSDLKTETEKVVDMVHQQSDETKAQVVGVIDSLKSLLLQYTSGANISEIKNQILDKANQLKGLVKDEASHAYEVSRDRAVQTVHDKPIASLAVAVGAGVLLGYILGSKTHSK